MDRDKIYNFYEKENVILRDHLATDRTILANERTYLSRLRAAVSLLAAGIGLSKYLEDSIGIKILGWLFILSSIAVTIVGTKRYFSIRNYLKLLFN